MEEFKSIDAVFVKFLFETGLNRPFIKMAGTQYKIPPSVIDKAVAIAKEDKDIVALKNACNAYKLSVQGG